jgi:hypothetical protein
MDNPVYSKIAKVASILYLQEVKIQLIDKPILARAKEVAAREDVDGLE